MGGFGGFWKMRFSQKIFFQGGSFKKYFLIKTGVQKSPKPPIHIVREILICLTTISRTIATKNPTANIYPSHLIIASLKFALGVNAKGRLARTAFIAFPPRLGL